MIIERARSERTRSRELRDQAEQLSQRLVEILRSFEGHVFGEAGENTFTLRVGRIRPAVGLLRQDLARWLERRGIAPADVQEVVLACSEACANAVEHPIHASRAAFDIQAVHNPRELVITVRDSGHWRSGPTTETRGRGMHLIRSLMDEVDVTQGADGSAIVMRRRLR